MTREKGVSQEEIILYPGKTRGVMTLLALCFCVYVGFDLWNKQQVEGLLILLISLLLLIAVISWIFPGAAHLKLTADGFTVKSLFLTRYQKWADVTNFREGHVPRVQGIKYDLSPQASKHLSLIEKVCSQFVAAEGFIINIYGIKNEDLVGLMTEWKNKAQDGPRGGE